MIEFLLNQPLAARRRIYFTAVSVLNLQDRCSAADLGIGGAGSWVVSISKNGDPAVAVATPPVVEVDSVLQKGVFYFQATVGNFDTLAGGVLRVTSIGGGKIAEPREIPFDVVAIDRYAAADGGMSRLDAAVSSLATAAAVAAIPTTPLLTADGRLAALDATISSRAATADARFGNLDAAMSTRAATGAAMTLTAGERNAVADALIARPIGTPAADTVGDAILNAGGGGGSGSGASVEDILDAVIEGPDQYDDEGEDLPVGHDADEYNITVAQALRELMAYVSNNWTGGDGPTVVMKSRVGGRNRVVATLNNGNRTVTSRNHD